jgi:DNA-binding CsgD family transcriptional regulator
MKHRTFRLTKREISIIELTAAGKSAKEAACDLDIAPRTVEKHLDHSRLKMEAKNTTHLVALCIATGMLDAAVIEAA